MFYNLGPDTNAGQYYITTVLTEWLDHKHVIMGIVLEGMNVVKKIEFNPTMYNDCFKDRPIKRVVVRDSGILPLERKFLVPKEAITGDGVPESKRIYLPPPEVRFGEESKYNQKESALRFFVFVTVLLLSKMSTICFLQSIHFLFFSCRLGII